MRIVVPMIVMVFAGIALGGGGSTLYWSGVVNRQFHAQAEWKKIVDKQSEAIELQRNTIRQQGEALVRLTAATDNYLAATRLPR